MSPRDRNLKVTTTALSLFYEFLLFGAIWMTPRQMLLKIKPWLPIAIFLGSALAVLLMLIWLTPLFTRRRFKSLEQILKIIPRKYIPLDGKWPPANGAVNIALLKKVVGRQAQLALEVDLSIIHSDGRYANIPTIISRFTQDPMKNLPLFLYAYFDKATPEVAKVVLSHKRHDFVQLMGKITRAELTNRPDRGVCLNIDLNDCEFVTP